MHDEGLMSALLLVINNEKVSEDNRKKADKALGLIIDRITRLRIPKEDKTEGASFIGSMGLKNENV